LKIAVDNYDQLYGYTGLRSSYHNIQE
jgi:hypothetical protein